MNNRFSCFSLLLITHYPTNKIESYLIKKEESGKETKRTCVRELTLSHKWIDRKRDKHNLRIRKEKEKWETKT